MLRKYSIDVKSYSEKYKGRKEYKENRKAVRRWEVDLHLKHLMKMSSRMKSLMIRSKSFNPSDESWNSGKKFYLIREVVNCSKMTLALWRSTKDCLL
jgi:hypothetical protein